MQCEKGRSLQPDEIITMDWLAENVVGKIPDVDELTEDARALVEFQGIRVDESDTEKSAAPGKDAAAENGGAT